MQRITDDLIALAVLGLVIVLGLALLPFARRPFQA
jgi:hypothetical protein